jgi:hypothetical protein
MDVLNEIEGVLRNSANSNNAGCLPLLFLGGFFLCLFGCVLYMINASITDILKPGLGFGGWCFVGAVVFLFLSMLTSGRL